MINVIETAMKWETLATEPYGVQRVYLIVSNLHNVLLNCFQVCFVTWLTRKGHEKLQMKWLEILEARRSFLEVVWRT